MAAIMLEVEAGKFANLSDRVEVFDASGQFLGTFTPPPRSEYEGLVVPFGDEEKRRRIAEAREGPWYTPAEVRVHLKNLEPR